MTQVGKAKPIRPSLARSKKPPLIRLLESRELYLFCLPGIIITLIYHYIPLYGVQIAFRQYSVKRGFWGSAWVGLDHFRRFFNGPYATEIIYNTFIIALYSLIVGFPIPILLALALNSFRHKRYRRIIQTVTYAPNFISVVVMCGMIRLFLSPSVGFVNRLLGLIGIQSINFMGLPGAFRHIYVWSGVWQSMGYSSVIYFAALSAVSPELHEAAIMDGASRLHRVWHVDLPTILPTITMLLILSFGGLLSVGFEKIYALQNALNQSVSEVISTYTYKQGILHGNISYSTAVGLFNSVVSSILVLSLNYISGKLSDNALW